MSRDKAVLPYGNLTKPICTILSRVCEQREDYQTEAKSWSVMAAASRVPHVKEVMKLIEIAVANCTPAELNDIASWLQAESQERASAAELEEKFQRGLRSY